MQGTLTLDTAPAAEPVTLAEAKAHCRVSHGDEDALLGALIQAARQYVEGATSRTLIDTVWLWKLDKFPCGRECLYVPLPPLQTVDTITYIDADGDSQAWHDSNYIVGTAHESRGRIALAPSAVWPITQSNRIDAVTIEFTAGYGGAGDVPAKFKQAALLLIGHWYANREAVGQVGSEVALAVESLLGLGSSGAYVHS